MPQKSSLIHDESLPVIYKLWKGVLSDNSTNKENLLNIDPDNSRNLNDNSDISFKLSDTVKFLNLSSNNSGFKIQVKFRTKWKPEGARGAGDPWVNNDNNNEANITLGNAWFGHLFKTVKLILGGQEIESINHFGTVFETMALLKNVEYQIGSGSKESYIPDKDAGTTVVADNAGYKKRLRYYNYNVPNADTYRYVNIFVPLHSIFGFCKHYTRVIRNIPLDITLVRICNVNNLFYGAAHTNIDFEVTKILLRIEYVIPNDKILTGLNDFLLSHEAIEAYFQAKSCDMFSGNNGTDINIQLGSKYSNPRYIIVACKDPAKNNNIQHNFGKLENGDIRDIKVTLDSWEYPNTDQTGNFSLNNFTDFYNAYDSVSMEFGNNGCMTMEDYKNLYPIFAFDCSASPEKGKNQTTNIRIDIKRNSVTTIPSLDYYVIVIYDKFVLLHYKDGRVSNTF